MKKLSILIIILFSINGCKYINTKEKYVGAKESKALDIPDSVDSPNSSSALDVPQIGANATEKTPDRSPPEMPLRTRQSDSGGLKIENENGYPVLTVKTEKAFMWEAMDSLSIEDWSQSSADEEACSITLQYVDSAAQQRKNANFIKKLFTRDRIYSDYSGLYTMSCKEFDSTTQVTFAKQDGTAAKSFIADSVMNKLYEQFE